MFWLGLVMIGCGIFLLVYGGMLFRFSLAVGAFVLGFSIASWLLSGQDQLIRIIVSLVTGGVLAIVGYMLVRLVLHIAGGILGAVLVLVAVSLLPFEMPSFVTLILLLAGTGVVGFFGNRLGDWVIILATTLAGAYAVIFGLTRMFPQAVTDVAAGVEYTSAQVPFTGPAFAVFLIVFAVGALAQFQLRSVRGRYVNL